MKSSFTNQAIPSPKTPLWPRREFPGKQLLNSPRRIIKFRIFVFFCVRSGSQSKELAPLPSPSSAKKKLTSRFLILSAEAHFLKFQKFDFKKINRTALNSNT